MAEKEPTIFCSRCGAEMKSKSRYCMKCGNLNYEHDANETMRQYIKEEDQEAYQVGSGKFMVNNNSSQIQVSIANNTGNTAFCFYLNFLVYLASLLISFLVCCKGNFSIDHIISSFFPLVCVLISIIFLYLYAMELIFIKCNKRWWGALIPFYNFFILSEIVFQKKWLGVICFIPVIGQIFLLVMFYQLGKKFRYNGFLTVLFLIVYIPIIGYGNHVYEGRQFVSDDEKHPLEKEYSRKRVFFFTCFLFLAVGAGMFLFLNQAKVESGANDVRNYYYVLAGNRLVNVVQKKISEKKVTCVKSQYSSDSGVYYFAFYDVGTVISLPFYFMREPIGGYVKVVIEGGVSSYYVSVGDGNYGYSEVLIDELDTDTVIEKYYFKDPINVTHCNFVKYSIK
ncbi:MAG: zinc ribbon domain-containing protein [Bacilli bacterium]|nr:zinc ribbon domain-containing protein [Bacilli bacterium]